MNARDFYEQYWLQDTPPPTDDPTTEDRKRLLLKAFELFNIYPPGKKLLDAGCGDGEFLEFFVRQGFDTYGIDVAETALDRARQRCPRALLYPGALEEPLP